MVLGKCFSGNGISNPPSYSFDVVGIICFSQGIKELEELGFDIRLSNILSLYAVIG
jgi:hypothetical protein